jgi:hypothetical protein
MKLLLTRSMGHSSNLTWMTFGALEKSVLRT